MKITYKSWTFLFSQTESAKPTREQSLSCESISADTLTAVVRCNDPTIMAFAKNDPIRVWENDSDASMQTYYLRSITRTGATSYRLVAWSAVGLLAAMAHKGGIYTGQTVAEVVKEICGNVPVVVKSVFANTKLYGWLPYCQPKADRRGKSARDNLVQVLFAIGAYLTTDLNGVLHIDALWDGASSTIGSNRMYASGGKVSYSDPISAVTVTEHQYIAGTDEKELFSGTSQQGDIITFSEPMHSLTATGFTILESGANYAKISSGSGSLKGKTYIHNARLVTQTVTENAAENVKSVTDATLVSLVNSSAVAKRLADYYKCRETITNGIVSGQEKPGHVVNVYHPYDKKMVSACIVSLDTTMSGTLKSEMAALVGFLPPQPETAEYYDGRVILTGSGEWTVPDGVTEIRAVLIGGGQGGESGSSGSLSTECKAINQTSEVTASTTTYRGWCPMIGGAGGNKGAGGDGGKVLTVSQAVTAGEKITYAAGRGGKGGAYSADAQTSGSGGTDTVFGSHSSATGSTTETGYYDSVSGDTYAAHGAEGVNGGAGGGGNGETNSTAYVEGGSVTDADGNTWTPGANPTSADTLSDSASAYGLWANSEIEGTYVKHWTCSTKAVQGKGAGGGAAVGANGKPGVHNANAPHAWGYSGAANTPSNLHGKAYAIAYGGVGGNGADATAPVKATVYGSGGTGGNGGGGAGGGGFAYGENRVSKEYPPTECSASGNKGQSGTPGLGSDGGEGGDGCIILYYRRPKLVQSGWLKDKNGKLVLDRLGRRIIK